jgi:hypothetical protein
LKVKKINLEIIELYENNKEETFFNIIEQEVYRIIKNDILIRYLNYKDNQKTKSIDESKGKRKNSNEPRKRSNSSDKSSNKKNNHRRSMDRIIDFVNDIFNHKRKLSLKNTNESFFDENLPKNKRSPQNFQHPIIPIIQKNPKNPIVQVYQIQIQIQMMKKKMMILFIKVNIIKIVQLNFVSIF